MQALLRLVRGISDDLAPHGWDFHYARELETVAGLLRDVPFKDYMIDDIVRIAAESV